MSRSNKTNTIPVDLSAAANRGFPRQKLTMANMVLFNGVVCGSGIGKAGQVELVI